MRRSALVITVCVFAASALAAEPVDDSGKSLLATALAGPLKDVREVVYSTRR